MGVGAIHGERQVHRLDLDHVVLSPLIGDVDLNHVIWRKKPLRNGFRDVIVNVKRLGPSFDTPFIFGYYLELDKGVWFKLARVLEVQDVWAVQFDLTNAGR